MSTPALSLSNTPLRIISLVTIFACSYHVPRLNKGAPRGDLGSCVQARETNSPRPGSNLWGRCTSSAPPRRCPQRGPSHGRDPAWKRHSLAPCPRRQRKNPDPRTVRLSSEKAPRKRRRPRRRIPRRLEKTSLDAAAENIRESPSAQTKIARGYMCQVTIHRADRSRPRRQRQRRVASSPRPKLRSQATSCVILVATFT